MQMPLSLLREAQRIDPAEAWPKLFKHAYDVCSGALTSENAVEVVQRRDQMLAPVDLFLASAGWDLWRDYESSASLTTTALSTWWNARQPGRAILILDALSLRELPWLLQGAAKHGLTIHQSRATGAELPADTNEFAKALGYASRSALDNNGAAGKGLLKAQRTETSNLHWKDCADSIGVSPDIIYWHHWPDDRVHELCKQGNGLTNLIPEVAEGLQSDDFWLLVKRLAQGRRLVITSDHGYAASGTFPDTNEPAQHTYLKERFKGGRWMETGGTPGPWVPPLDLRLTTRHREASFALGRRKWKNPGGYPTLVHGGLSLLEVAVPFVELSQLGGA